MSSFHDNINHRFFARWTQPMSSPLRQTHRNAVKSRLTIGNIRLHRETRNIGKADPPPSGVTTSRPQAKLETRQESMTSLNPQGQSVNI